jgi:hypothetical protein
MAAHDGLFSHLKPNNNLRTNEHYLPIYQIGWKLGWNISSK